MATLNNQRVSFKKTGRCHFSPLFDPADPVQTCPNFLRVAQEEEEVQNLHTPVRLMTVDGLMTGVAIKSVFESVKKPP